MRLLTGILVLVATSVNADTEIYRCALDDGTFAFQEKPCPEPSRENDVESTGETDVSASDDDAFDFVNPFDEPGNTEQRLPTPVSEDRAECEKTTRDAIDAIDLEMRQSSYSKEQGREYLAELKELTQQLRACKQL